MDRTKRMARDLQPRRAHYEPDVKFRILHLFEQGIIPPDDIAKSFGITVRTIYNWRDEYDRRGMAGLEDAPKSGRTPLLSREKVRKAVEDVGKKDAITVKGVRGRISEKFGIRYSHGHVWSILSRMGLTYKKADPVHRRAATNEEIEAWAGENMPVIRQYLSKGYVLLSVDEVHPEIDGAAHYGYAESGQRVYATYNGSKSRLHIVGAVASGGRSIFRTQVGSNSGTFISFLEDLRAKFHRAVILLDNASYHASKDVKKWLREHLGIVPIYLPVGSPHMNSIENLWGMMYAYLRVVECHTFAKFKYHVFYFLRRRRFDLDVRSRLDSRLDPAAEAHVIRTRERLELLQ